jgi:hypothetical protein
MADDVFESNLLRWISSELYFSLGMQTSREMYGKSYFSLGIAEKTAVDNAVGGAVQANYLGMTPELLVQFLAPAQPKAPPAKQPVGFQTPNPKS